jgi:hypothetical protein
MGSKAGRFDPRHRQRIFPLASCVHTSSEADPASYPMGTEGPFPGGKSRPGRDADHSSHPVPRPRMSRSYISSPFSPAWRQYDIFTLFLPYYFISLAQNGFLGSSQARPQQL